MNTDDTIPPWMHPAHLPIFERGFFFFHPHVYQCKLCRRACVVERITHTRWGEVAWGSARNQDPLVSNHSLHCRFYFTPLEKAITAGEGLHTLYYIQDESFRPFITWSTACILTEVCHLEDIHGNNFFKSTVGAASVLRPCYYRVIL